MKKILVVRPDVLGDVILTLPFLNTCKQVFSSATISVVAQPYTKELLSMHSAVDELLLDWRKTGEYKGPQDLFKYVSFIKSKAFDAVFFPVLDEFFMRLCFLAGIKVRVGDKNNVVNRLFLTHGVDINFRDLTKHEAEQHIDLLKPFQSDVKVVDDFKLQTQKKDIISLSKKLKPFVTDQTKLVVVHAGFGDGNRSLPTSDYARLIDQIHNQTDYKVVLTGSEKEDALNQEIIQKCKKIPLNLAGKTSLNELMVLLKASSCVVGAETGPLHLAAALKRPIVSISPTKFIKSFRWGPWKTNHVVIKGNHLCEDICHTYKNNCTAPECSGDRNLNDIFQAIQFMSENKQKFPQDEKVYWFKTNAKVALHCDDVSLTSQAYVFDLKKLCKEEQIPLFVTTTNPLCRQLFGQDEKNFFYCPWYFIHKWVSFMAKQDITIWHEVSQRPFQLWFKWIQRLTAPKVCLPPVLVRTKKKFETLKAFVDYYLEQSKKSSY